MSEAPRYVTLRDYLRVLREHRVMIVLVTLLFGAAALAYSLQQEEVYVAEASVSFQDVAEGAELFGQSPTFPVPAEQRAAEASQSITRPQILRQVQQELDGDLSLDVLQSRITTSTETRTNFVVISATAPDPELAAQTANVMAEQAAEVENRVARQRFAEAAKLLQAEFRTIDDGGDEQDEGLDPESIGEEISRNQLERQIASLEALAEFARPVQIARAATVPEAPVSPNPVRNTLLGLLVGLTLGVIAAFVRDSLDRRLRSSGDVEAEMKLPVVGHVSADALGRAVAPTNGRPTLTGPELEAFRILRMNLDFLDVDRRPRTIAVTSALPEEGKSTVAASLAYASALAGKRVVLVECDLRRPALAERLGLTREPGLTECLARGSDPAGFIQHVEVAEPLPEPDSSPNGGRFSAGGGASADPVAAENGSGSGERREFDCITAGAPAPRPAETLNSNRFRELLERLASEYDAVFLDTSPLLAVVDTLALIPHVDGIVVCVRMSRATRDQVAATRQTLERFPVRPTGVVATGIQPGEELYYGHYSYAYAYGEHHV